MRRSHACLALAEKTGSTAYPLRIRFAVRVNLEHSSDRKKNST